MTACGPKQTLESALHMSAFGGWSQPVDATLCLGPEEMECVLKSE
jgi:hypothetical protein